MPIKSPLTASVTVDADLDYWEFWNADYTVSSAAELASALSTIGSAGGATIALKDGVYGELDVSTAFTSRVTIRARNQNGATFTKITGTSPANVTFQDLKVTLPDPGVAQDFADTETPVVFSDPTDVTVTRCEISGAARLRSGYGVSATGTATRLIVQNSHIYHLGRGGIRLATNTDCTIQDNEINGTVGTPIGTATQTTTSGLIIQRNLIYDVNARTSDPDWTDRADPDVTDWASLHYSLIALRDAQVVQILDNTVHSCRTGIIQLYEGEGGSTYQYGDIEIRRNLFYHIEQSSPYFFVLVYGDPVASEKVGPFHVTDNTFVGSTKTGWTAGVDPLSDRFDSPTVAAEWVVSGTDTLEGNLVIGRMTPIAGSRNNVTYYSPGTTGGTDNVEISSTYSGTTDWIDQQFVEGTYYLGEYDGTQIRSGLTFTPKASSPLATAGVGGGHVGAVAPA